MDQTKESITCTECSLNSKCFRKLIPAELEFIGHYKVQISYSRGEDICKQGAFASAIIFNLDGLIKLSKLIDDLKVKFFKKHSKLI